MLGRGPGALDNRAKPGQQPAGLGTVRRGEFGVLFINMIRTFGAGLVVLRFFIVLVFALVKAVIILDLFPAGSLALAPTTIIDRGKDDPPEA